VQHLQAWPEKVNSDGNRNMGANPTTTQTYDNRAPWGAVIKETYVRTCTDYQRVNRLVVDQLGVQPTEIDPSKYGAIVHALQRFTDNRVLWDTELDATLLRKHMAFTLFAPAGRADRARIAVDALAAEGYLGDIKARSWDEEALSLIRPHVRFPKQKADRCEACLDLFRTMQKELPQIQGYMERRRWLEKNMPGYGPKAATHFMRNSGMMHYNDGLPIIDVHIHKALEHFGFKHVQYEESCHAFQSMADLIEVPVLILDAVLWCAYAKNWELDGADFDNFGVEEPLKEGTVNNDTGKDRDETSGTRRGRRSKASYRRK
jgi:thermostable 8-oxoguanine DNA glycosylase